MTALFTKFWGASVTDLPYSRPPLPTTKPTDSRWGEIDRADVRRYLIRAIRRRRYELGIVCALQGAAAVASLVAPYVLGRVIDTVLADEPVALSALAVLVFAGLAAQAVLSYLSTFRSFALGEDLFDELRQTFFDSLLALPVQVVEQIPTGELVSRSTSDMDAVHEIARIGIPEVVVGLVSVTITVAAGFVVNPVVALGMLVGVPILILAKRRYARRAPALYLRELRARAAAGSSHADTVAGADDVATLGMGARRRRRHVADVEDLADATRATVRFEITSFPAVQAGYHLPLFGVLAVGAVAVSMGRASVGEVAAIALFTRTVLTPLDDLMYWFNESYSSGAALSRILGIVAGGGSDAASPVREQRSTQSTAPLGLRVTDVHYSYQQADQPALRGVSLVLEPGRKYCVVGRSGAGKSTLALLIAGILKPSRGRVTPFVSDESDVQEPAGWATLVTQHDHVFTGSVRENVVFVADEVTDNLLVSALKSAGAEGWVGELEDGIDAVLGVDGYSPSPAQARQLALARIFVLRPRLLLLDEATASLPDVERAAFAESLHRELVDTTLVHVAHDLDTAFDCDHVFVMEAGRIVEQGAPDDLIARRGHFHRLWAVEHL